ncbi:F-box domain protein [Nemania abortiva]|nr:F-box domain protein [Nemania abortiva]
MAIEAPSSLTDLPIELLPGIIEYSLPEGFESLALTCRALYTLCIPFIEHHNRLRKRFREFRYDDVSTDPSLPCISAAITLIAYIAAEPRAARYIIHADFELDGVYPSNQASRSIAPVLHDTGPVAALFAHSAELAEAGLDWEEYYARAKSQVNRDDSEWECFYSQHAAAFVLTLLPNAKDISLPMNWVPFEETEWLIRAIIRKTRQPNSLRSRPSLAEVADLRMGCTPSCPASQALSILTPFLSLPHMQCLVYGYGEMSGHRMFLGSSQSPHLRFGDTLTTAHFWDADIDGVLVEFLRRTPDLKSLRYARKRRADRWCKGQDLCRAVTAIGREIGSSLEELSLTEAHFEEPPPTEIPPHASLPPVKVYMRSFKCLRRLEFPLDLALCNIRAALSGKRNGTRSSIGLALEALDNGLTEQQIREIEVSVRDLIPPSVVELSLLSRGQDHHDIALKAMFRGFAANKHSRWPALKDLYLSCPTDGEATEAYLGECTKLSVETANAGVVLHLRSDCKDVFDWPEPYHPCFSPLDPTPDRRLNAQIAAF